MDEKISLSNVAILGRTSPALQLAVQLKPGEPFRPSGLMLIMSKRRRLSSPQLVQHPRYGAQPHVSGIKVSEADIRASFWSLQGGEIYPESVLLANTAQQNYAVFPRLYYVDSRRVCRVCGRPFLFFAKEQRYWFETLRFFVDADCVQCPDCRRESRSVQRRMRSYSDATAKEILNDQELDALVRDATFLFRRGALNNPSTLGALKNRAQRQIPGFTSTANLTQALSEARAGGLKAPG